MELTKQTELIPSSDGPIGVAVRRPVGSDPHRVLVVFHHGPGLDEDTVTAMELFAATGTYVIAFDRYHRLGEFHTFRIRRPDGSFDSDVMVEARAALVATDDDMVARDLDAVLRFVAEDPAASPNPMLGVGYCVGVRSLILAMADHPDRFAAGVGYHPSFCVVPENPDPAAIGILTGPSPHRRVAEFRQERLALFFGTADEMSPVAMNQPLIDAVIELPGGRGRIEEVVGGDHGFAVPGHAWLEGASDRAFEDALQFLGLS